MSMFYGAIAKQLAPYKP